MMTRYNITTYYLGLYTEAVVSEQYNGARDE